MNSPPPDVSLRLVEIATSGWHVLANRRYADFISWHVAPVEMPRTWYGDEVHAAAAAAMLGRYDDDDLVLLVQVSADDEVAVAAKARGGENLTRGEAWAGLRGLAKNFGGVRKEEGEESMVQWNSMVLRVESWERAKWGPELLDSIIYTNKVGEDWV